MSASRGIVYAGRTAGGLSEVALRVSLHGGAQMHVLATAARGCLQPSNSARHLGGCLGLVRCAGMGSLQSMGCPCRCMPAGCTAHSPPPCIPTILPVIR